MKFIETSAKDSKNVEDAFLNITKEIKSKVTTNTKKNPPPGGVKLSASKKVKDSKAQGGCGC